MFLTSFPTVLLKKGWHKKSENSRRKSFCSPFSVVESTAFLIFKNKTLSKNCLDPGDIGDEQACVHHSPDATTFGDQGWRSRWTLYTEKHTGEISGGHVLSLPEQVHLFLALLR